MINPDRCGPVWFSRYIGPNQRSDKRKSGRRRQIGLIGGDGDAPEACRIGIGANRGAELLEDSLGQSIGAPIVFRVPLHTDSVADGGTRLAGDNADGLDGAVWGNPFGNESGSEL